MSFIDKYVLYIDIAALFLDMEGEATVNMTCRQAVTGAAVAAGLVWGANAAPGAAAGQDVPSYRTPTVGAQATLGERAASAVVHAWRQGFQLTLPFHDARLAEALKTCRDKVLDGALDAAGEIAARLKQL